MDRPAYDLEAERQGRIQTLRDLLHATGLPVDETAQIDAQRSPNGTPEWRFFAFGCTSTNMEDLVQRALVRTSQPLAAAPANRPPALTSQVGPQQPQQLMQLSLPRRVVMGPKQSPFSKTTLKEAVRSRPKAPTDPPVPAAPQQPRPRPLKIVCLTQGREERLQRLKEKLREAGLADDASAGLNAERVSRPLTPERSDWYYTAHGQRADRIDKLIRKIQVAKRSRAEMEANDGQAAIQEDAHVQGRHIQQAAAATGSDTTTDYLTHNDATAREPTGTAGTRGAPASHKRARGAHTQEAHGLGAGTHGAQPHPDTDALLHETPAQEDDPLLLDLHMHPDLLSHFATFTHSLCERHKQERWLQQRVCELEAEVATLQDRGGDARRLTAENVALKSENARLKSENARLRDELREQKAKVEAVRKMFA